MIKNFIFSNTCVIFTIGGFLLGGHQNQEKIWKKIGYLYNFIFPKLVAGSPGEKKFNNCTYSTTLLHPISLHQS